MDPISFEPHTDRPDPLGITPEPWVQDALCAQVDGDLWFPDKGGWPRGTRFDDAFRTVPL